MWLSLAALRELPLDAEVRCRLLQALAVQPQPPEAVLATPLQLQVEVAEATACSMQDSLDRGAWLAAVERQSELRTLITALSQQRPDHRNALWQRYGELLGWLTAVVHGAVNAHSTTPPEPLLRAELCWRLMELLEQGRQLPFDPPDWLAVLEQQLVQDGAQFWQELIGAEGAPEAQPRALSLLLRLCQLLDPCPDWVEQSCRRLLETWLQPRLAEETLSRETLEQLLPWLERWPVAAAQQPGLATALLRLRLGLELGDQMAARQANPVASSATPSPAPSQAATSPVEVDPLQLVLLRNDASARPGWFNLSPLLTADLDELEHALAAFVAAHANNTKALSASSGLVASLVPLWRSGGRLPAGSFPLVSYAAAAWQRRLGERCQPAPMVGWQQGLVVELEHKELTVLLTVLGRDPSLEQALASLRRHHHDDTFWQADDPTPWYGQLSCQEALRRLQRESGFYASTSAPLESLRLWAQGAMAGLLAAQVWSDSESCLGPWLALGQQLIANGQPLPPLGSAPKAAVVLQALAGLEAVYVGDGAEELTALHRQGALFRPHAFGLRCLAAPASRHPQRPHGSFEQSLAQLVEQLEALHHQRPFQVLLTDAGAYRLGLAQALHTRLGVRALCTASPLPAWLAEG